MLCDWAGSRSRGLVVESDSQYIDDSVCGCKLYTANYSLHIVSTQPCIPPGSLNRVPASAGVRAGMSALPGGR